MLEVKADALEASFEALERDDAALGALREELAHHVARLVRPVLGGRGRRGEAKGEDCRE